MPCKEAIHIDGHTYGVAWLFLQVHAMHVWTIMKDVVRRAADMQEGATAGESCRGVLDEAVLGPGMGQVSINHHHIYHRIFHHMTISLTIF